MIKIVFTGPESTGKTTMTKLLAQHLNIPYVPEVAREYLHDLNKKYAYEDVLNIALLQMAEEEKVRSYKPAMLVCDTDILTNKIWCEDKFQRCEKWVTDAFVHRNADIYFLCAPDFQWQPDMLREDANRREIIFDKYKTHLKHFKKHYIELNGNIDERFKKVIQYIASHSQMY